MKRGIPSIKGLVAISITPYILKINELLKPKDGEFTALDLFAGCGGLSLGFEAAGFKCIGMEMDRDCCDTYNRNLKGKCVQAILDKSSHFPMADIVIGGPPCQPFSVGGEQKGLKDSRDGFPIFIEAIRKIKPKMWLFENVRGLLYRNRWYFNEILAELQRHNYIVEPKLLNAFHFDVPQNRERIIVVGYHGKYNFPRKSKNQITAGDALGKLVLESNSDSKFLTPSMDAYIAKYEKASKCIVPRDLHLTKPARTLTCRNIADSTGDMHRIRLPDGRRRRLSIREAARLQSFPDWFEFCGTEFSAFNQIGNAVPPLFAFHLAETARCYLEHSEISETNISPTSVTIQPKLAREICSMPNAYYSDRTSE